MWSICGKDLRPANEGPKDSGKYLLSADSIQDCAEERMGRSTLWISRKEILDCCCFMTVRRRARPDNKGRSKFNRRRDEGSRSSDRRVRMSRKRANRSYAGLSVLISLGFLRPAHGALVCAVFSATGRKVSLRTINRQRGEKRSHAE